MTALGFVLGASVSTRRIMRASEGVRDSMIRRRNGRCSVVVKVFTNPWSVSSAELGSQLFALSLFPYLAFLRSIGNEETDCPPLAVRGFQFLLVFVAATIPAGIYAKVAYNDILANVDWLHGGAESFLTITNLIILLGFKSDLDGSNKKQSRNLLAKSALGASIVAWIGLVLLGSPITPSHAQPGNALSVLTWIIHVSSLIEWLVVMDIIWDRAQLTGNEKWKGLTWGMIPLHTSGLLACTFHLFYNAPVLDPLVTMQAALTCIGNTTMWYAAQRISKGRTKEESSKAVSSNKNDKTGAKTINESGSNAAEDLIKVGALSVVASLFLHYGTLFFDFPFEPTLPLAMAFVLLPTAANVSKWVLRSRSS
ncbi:hypothetical protein NDN08_007864 [Rhodosorus marinus]|uniref:Uncharacterized protein n=1 Tax=Rhodosorus marinus TaxID=101924 RepID=A0AAV8UYR6_9RHOD|nr:hypothetical protein NDN08_007864 [Rhodosorus marinus]